MLTVVLFLWKDSQHMWRHEYHYGVHHVERAMRMISKNLTVPHRFVVAADDHYYGVVLRSDLDVGIVRIPKELYVPGKRFQKLMVFRPDAATLFGERMLIMDLDNVVVGSLDEIASREEDIVLWNNPNARVSTTPYNTSVILMTAGCRPHVWTEFEVNDAIQKIRINRLSGTDQAWVSHCLKNEATFTREDGVYSYRLDYLRTGLDHRHYERVVCFHGNMSPDSSIVSRNHSWLQQVYRGAEMIA